MKKILDTPKYLINDFVDEMLQKNSFTVFGVGGIVGLEFWEYPRDPDQMCTDVLYIGTPPDGGWVLPPLYLIKFFFSESEPYTISGVNSTYLPDSVVTLSKQKVELEELKIRRYSDLDELVLNGW